MVWNSVANRTQYGVWLCVKNVWEWGDADTLRCKIYYRLCVCVVVVKERERGRDWWASIRVEGWHEMRVNNKAAASGKFGIYNIIIRCVAHACCLFWACSRSPAWLHYWSLNYIHACIWILAFCFIRNLYMRMFIHNSIYKFVHLCIT